jgi:hypothetical protein
MEETTSSRGWDDNISKRILRGVQSPCQTDSDNSLGYYEWWLLHHHDSDLSRYVVLFNVKMQRNVTEMCQTFRETLYDMKMRSELN